MLPPPPFSPLSWGFSSSALRSLIHGLSMAAHSVSHACTLALLVCYSAEWACRLPAPLPCVDVPPPLLHTGFKRMGVPMQRSA